jgi:predicted TIM-barrel fold metal-dependent hydrolase
MCPDVLHDQSPMVVISVDMHAGACISGYKPYLESRWHDDFDQWSREFSDPWEEIDAGPREIKVGAASLRSVVNWEGETRRVMLDAEGIVAEVIFPNTAPPFFPSGVISAGPPTNRSEYERRWAGLRAHNRWLRDFCDELPGRRAGVAQIFLNDVDAALEEVRWAHEAGLRGGIVLPSDSTASGLVPLYYPRYDPLWDLCAELGVPVHRHGSISGEPSTFENGVGAGAIAIMESQFFAHRGLSHLMFAGVFERFPKLKFVLTEQGAGWIPSYLSQLDGMCKSAQQEGTIMSKFAGEAVGRLRRLPSEYFARSCFVGASFLSSAEAAIRHDIGLDRIMWAADFPHAEGTSPYSRQALAVAFAGVPVSEVIKMTSTTAAGVYGFDLGLLTSVASTVGPTPAEWQFGSFTLPKYPEETVCSVFAPTGDLIGRPLKVVDT